MKKFGLSGFYEHPLTTILGIILICAGIYTFIFTEKGWPDAFGAIGTGAGVLGITFKGNNTTANQQ